MTSKRANRLAVLSVLPLLFTSCINFEGQTVSYRYDSKQDQLRVFQVYERIYAEGDGGRLTKREMQQLASLTDNQTTFVFDNWLGVYNDKESRERVAEIKSMPVAADAAQAALLNAELEVHKALLASVHVTNGQFFLNDKKELCAYQTVTISNVSQLIEAANRYGSLKVRSQRHSKFGKEAQRQIREFAEDGKWVELDGARLTVRFFQTREDFAEGLKNLSRYKANGKPALPNAFQYNEPFAQLTFGKEDAVRTDIQIDNLQEGKYNPLLLDHVRKHYELRESVDIEKLRKEFLEKGQVSPA